MKLIQKALDFFCNFFNNRKELRRNEPSTPIVEDNFAGRIEFEGEKPKDSFRQKYDKEKKKVIDTTTLKVNKLIKELSAGGMTVEEQMKKRLLATLELSKMGIQAKSAIPILIEKLFDIKSEIRKASRFALEKIDEQYFLDEGAIGKIPFLFKRLGDDKQVYRTTATAVLKNMGEKASNYCIDFLKKDADDYDKVKIIQLLSQIRPFHKDVFKVVIEEVKSTKNRDVKETAIIALGNLGLASKEILILLTNELSLKNASYTKKAVLRTLAKFGIDSLVIIPKIIFSCFGHNDHEIRKEAINTVIGMGENAIPYLLEFYHRKDGYTAQDIKDILDKLDQLTIDNSKVQIYINDFDKYNNVDWYIKELFDVLNRPHYIREDVITCLKRLGYFPNQLK